MAPGMCLVSLHDSCAAFKQPACGQLSTGFARRHSNAALAYTLAGERCLHEEGHNHQQTAQELGISTCAARALCSKPE